MDPITVICNTNPGNEPVYQSEGSSGADLKADIRTSLTLKPGERILVPTGIKLQIPKGYEAQVRPRSGLAVKYGVTVLNTPGTIDADYRGEVKVMLINLGDSDFIVNPGDRIAQIVFAKVERVFFIVSQKTMESTLRGEGGFGSTGF